MTELKLSIDIFLFCLPIFILLDEGKTAEAMLVFLALLFPDSAGLLIAQISPDLELPIGLFRAAVWTTLILIALRVRVARSTR